jgi:hypothetical protein
MRTLLGLLLLLTTTPLWAASKSCPSGMLTPAPITATATPSPDTVTIHGAPGMTFQAINTAGTATVEVQACCVGTCATTATWATVTGTSMALTVSSSAVSILYPACVYRAYATACTGCSVSVGFACAGP